MKNKDITLKDTPKTMGIEESIGFVKGYNACNNDLNSLLKVINNLQSNIDKLDKQQISAELNIIKQKYDNS